MLVKANNKLAITNGIVRKSTNKVVYRVLFIEDEFITNKVSYFELSELTQVNNIHLFNKIINNGKQKNYNQKRQGI